MDEIYPHVNPNNPQMLLFVTNGNPTVKSESPCHMAQTLHDLDIDIVALGIGDVTAFSTKIVQSFSIFNI